VIAHTPCRTTRQAANCGVPTFVPALWLRGLGVVRQGLAGWPGRSATGVLLALQFGAGTCGVLRIGGPLDPHKHRQFRVATLWCGLLRCAYNGLKGAALPLSYELHEA
jgi:hypothetical protein